MKIVIIIEKNEKINRMLKKNNDISNKENINEIRLEVTSYIYNSEKNKKML